MFRPSTFEKGLENATSHLRLEPDWPSILQICDAIRQNDVSVKQAMASIKKKMTSPNPHTSYYALLVLESVVKNCGAPMHEEIASLENCEMFSSFVEETPHENARAKMLELLQTWSFAFRSSNKHQTLKDTMTILKAKGHVYPELKEADAMFTADTAPDWADGKVCHRCRVQFSLTQRRHHCRNCGQIFCGQCSSKQCPLPKFGIEKEVRVCDGCYASLQKPIPVKPKSSENELPAEYLNSSLAQQAQTPPKKTEQELKEEEELQLALALSQSEAEQKTKTSATYRVYQKSPSPEPPAAPTLTTQLSIEETPADPELAKYLNRSYWEQRKTTESPVSPSAPSPMPQNSTTSLQKIIPGDIEIDDFATNMKSQVEIFVNRMKSNSSRGRNIANDSSVQTLFMSLTSFHSRLLGYIKDMDDKRMWYEQLQDKLAQVKDSRAALDVLRLEHVEKMRRLAEEQERQRQLQMAHKLEIMRKKKQEYLQYQRQLALQRIQEQEREMQIRQEQQKAQYRMGQAAFPYVTGQQGSPSHQIPGQYPGTYGYNPSSPSMQRFPHPHPNPVHGQPPLPGCVPMPGMYTPGIPTEPIPGMHQTPNVSQANTQVQPPPWAEQPQGLMNNMANVNTMHARQQNANVTNTIPPNSGPNATIGGAPIANVMPSQGFASAPTTLPPNQVMQNMPGMNPSNIGGMPHGMPGGPQMMMQPPPPPHNNSQQQPQQQQPTGPVPVGGPGSNLQPGVGSMTAPTPIAPSNEANAPKPQPEVAPQHQKLEEDKPEVTTAELISFD